MAEVYFFKTKGSNLQDLKKAGTKISALFYSFWQEPNQKLAIKIHFGEKGNKTFISPIFVKAVYDALKKKIKEIALIDCTVLYKSDRSRASSHIKLAKDHGFGFAPIIIADGENGDEEAEIAINKKHFKKVKLGRKVQEFDAVLSIAHFKGHSSAGFGGALKNLGMGFASKRGKLEMHRAFKLRVNPRLCQKCEVCIKNCAAKAIFLTQQGAEINYQKCVGCGQCISLCPAGAIEIPWQDTRPKDLQEKMVEYAYAALQGKKAFFVNVLLNITDRCDCVGQVMEPIIPDIGILASEDIVALEQASLDLVGEKNFRKPEIDPTFQIKYAQQLGLGNNKYKLIKITL